MDDDSIPDTETNYPTKFQRRTFWIALTAISFVIISAIAVGSLILGGQILGFLKPILFPIVVAGIIAYLLEPVVSLVERKFKWRYNRSMLLVFVTFLLAIVLLIIAVLVPSFGQAHNLIEDWDKYQIQITEIAKTAADDIREKINHPVAKEYADYQRGIDWLAEEGPDVGQKVGGWVWGRLMGGLDFLVYLLGLLLVPLYLFYFLKESHTIKNTWSDYLPLRASRFKDEVVDTLKEVNQYLVSFFRGQMVVSLIDGVLIAFALSLLGLPYAPLIGVFLAVLGLIPYIGNLLVMIPAIVIAIVHFGHKTPIDYDLSSDVSADQVKYVQAEDWDKKERKYIADVKQITLVYVTDDENNLVPAYVPYINSDLPTDAEKPAPKPVIAGEFIDVTMDNGLVQKKEIKSIIGEKKRAWVMTHAWSYLPNMWFYPLIVLAIFIILQQVNGLVTAPKIVGDSVGLHPLTVIFSVLFWSFLLGGLLGALLAIPLTASLKVLFRRYIWLQRIEPRVGPLGEKPKGTEA